MNWALRAVGVADESFLQRVYAGTREDELSSTDWDEPTRATFLSLQYRAQAQHYRMHWPGAEHAVIVAIDAAGLRHDAGRLWLDRRADTLHVLDIALLPAWRRLGIGGSCLRQLMAQAQAAGRTVSIYVEAGNPARHLYERLGFRAVGAPEGVHQRMAWGAQTTVNQETCNEQA
jgi:ribosomal protein S18 acetylase RimI-like enzyme